MIIYDSKCIGVTFQLGCTPQCRCRLDRDPPPHYTPPLQFLAELRIQLCGHFHTWNCTVGKTMTQPAWKLSKAVSRAGTRICASHLLPACLCTSPCCSEWGLLRGVLPWCCVTCLGASGSNAYLKLVWHLRGENQSRSLPCIYCTMCVVTLMMSSDSIILLKFIPDKRYRYGYRGKNHIMLAVTR